MRLCFLLLTATLLVSGGCRTRSNDGATTKSLTDHTAASPMTRTNPNVYTQIISYLELVPSTPDGGTNVTYRVVAKTELEVFCERQCGHFELVETKDGAKRRFKAIKHLEIGNTTPARLNEERYVSGKREEIQDLIVHNVGRQGQDIEASRVIDEKSPNFYAAMAVMKKNAATATRAASVEVEFGDKKMTAIFSDQTAEAPVQSSAADQIEGFVMGSIVQVAEPDQPLRSVFRVKSFDPSISF